MKLRTYMSSLSADEKNAFAKRAKTKTIYLIQIAGGHAKPSFRMAQQIEAACEGKVTRQDLRPDIFGRPVRSEVAA